MNQTDNVAAAEDRSRFFWWLAEWFLSAPDADRLATLPQPDGATPDPADPMGAAWHGLAAARGEVSDAGAERLGVEYTRLFSGLHEGLGPPPPYESVWREGRLVGESTVAVIEAYAQAGFADIDPAAGPQDHGAVEMKFLALLALRESEAWRAQDQEAAVRRLRQQRGFLHAHLGAWAPRWADAIRSQSREPLYAALAALLLAALDQAASELDGLASPPAG